MPSPTPCSSSTLQPTLCPDSLAPSPSVMICPHALGEHPTWELEMETPSQLQPQFNGTFGSFIFSGFNLLFFECFSSQLQGQWPEVLRQNSARMDITQEENTHHTTRLGQEKRQRCSVQTGSPIVLTAWLSKGGFQFRSPCKSSWTKPSREDPEKPLLLEFLQVPGMQQKLTPQPSPESSASSRQCSPSVQKHPT